jgi:S-disulfanyl-L-cysteine oxidoreductase SoxD
MPIRDLLAAMALCLVAGAALAAETPRLGQAPDAKLLEGWDMSIPPDGAGLPPGRGTVAQGKAVYEAQCLACHGANGEGKPADRLAGGIGSLATPTPVKTVASFWPYATTLFDYIRRAMPYQAPQSLGDDEAYAVTAYILSLDNIVPADAELGAANLAAVKMPNRDGFVPWWPAPPKR